jgi:acetyl-CoA carboxylase biotin carboxyl carrier protein
MKSPIDATLIRSLAAILKETDLSEIEVEQKGLRLRVARNVTVAAQVVAPSAALAAAAAPPAVTLDAAPGDAPRKAPVTGAVTSPMVGTVYRAAAPDKPNFVEVGSAVRQGQTILIIEAMKTFNEIPAPRAGTVTEILVASGEPVEFGQALVVIA